MLLIVYRSHIFLYLCWFLQFFCRSRFALAILRWQHTHLTAISLLSSRRLWPEKEGLPNDFVLQLWQFLILLQIQYLSEIQNFVRLIIRHIYVVHVLGVKNQNKKVWISDITQCLKSKKVQISDKFWTKMCVYSMYMSKIRTFVCSVFRTLHKSDLNLIKKIF